MFVFVVSQSIQAINEAVDAGDSAQTLAALRNPGAGLYGVTSECAQTYQTDLTRIKEDKKAEGGRQLTLAHSGSPRLARLLWDGSRSRCCDKVG